MVSATRLRFANYWRWSGESLSAASILGLRGLLEMRWVDLRVYPLRSLLRQMRGKAVTCPHCRQKLVPLPRPPHEGPTWEWCERHGYWRTSAGVLLVPTPYRKTGAADDLPLAPGPAEALP